MTEPDEQSREREDLTPRLLQEAISIRRSLNVIVVGLVCIALFYANDFFLPVVLAIVLALVLRPIVRTMMRIGLPASLAAAIVVFGLTGSLGGAAYYAAEPAGRWVDDAPRIGREIRFKFRDLIRSASAVGDLGEQVKEIADGPAKRGVQEVVVREPGLVSRAASGGANLLAGALLCIILLYFLLATADMLLEKAIQLTPRFRDKLKAAKIARQIEREVSRYLLTVSAINAALGFSIAFGMYLIDMPSFFLWGAMAALLNFIPYIGSIVGALVVFAVSVVTFETAGEIAAPPLIYLGLSALEGQLLTPLILGKRLNMNPVAIFLSVAFWGWLWGFAGALLAVPIMLIVKIAADHVERWAPLSAYLSGYAPRERDG